MCIFRHQVLKPIVFKASYQFNDEVKIHCPICVIENHSHRAKKLTTTKGLFFHIKQFHKHHPDVEFTLQVLECVTMAFQMQMITHD